MNSKYDYRAASELELRKKVSADEKAFLKRIEDLEKNEQRNAAKHDLSAARLSQIQKVLAYLATEALPPVVDKVPGSSSSSSSTTSTTVVSSFDVARLMMMNSSLSPGTAVATLVASAATASTVPLTEAMSSSSISPSVQRRSTLVSFCVICQENTANVALLSCGHICLCRSHAEHMTDNRMLKECPLCKAACAGYVSLNLC